jgi:hypothetical protein
VIAPISQTRIVMSPQLLPSLPDGYIYELWATDTSGERYTIMKFYWDNALNRFMDADSIPIDSVVPVKYDLLDPFYDRLEVSVETVPDAEPHHAGPIMLQDQIVDSEVRPMSLIFPFDMGLARAGFCMETPTDRDSRSNEAGGVWFAHYTYDSNLVSDTIDIEFRISNYFPRVLEIDSLYFECVASDDLGNCTLYVDVTDTVNVDPSYPWDSLGIDTVNLGELANTIDSVGVQCIEIVIDSTYLIDTLLIDTFVHRTVEFDFVTMYVNVDSLDIDTFFVDTCTGETTEVELRSFSDIIHNLNYITDSTIAMLDQFLPDYDDVPDLIGSGWHYKGWIMSPYLDTACSDLGRMTKPVWSEIYLENTFPNADNWAVISTGNFTNFEYADQGNPYSLNLRVPDVPGEDFIVNLPCLADSGSIYFADSTLGMEDVGQGDIFITVEPDNYNTNTNFPLILFTTRYTIPSYFDVSDTFPNRTQTFDLWNQSNVVANNTAGFPHIKVILIRE